MWSAPLSTKERGANFTGPYLKEGIGGLHVSQDAFRGGEADLAAGVIFEPGVDVGVVKPQVLADAVGGDGFFRLQPEDLLADQRLHPIIPEMCVPDALVAAPDLEVFFGKLGALFLQCREKSVSIEFPGQLRVLIKE